MMCQKSSKFGGHEPGAESAWTHSRSSSFRGRFVCQRGDQDGSNIRDNHRHFTSGLILLPDMSWSCAAIPGMDRGGFLSRDCILESNSEYPKAILHGRLGVLLIFVGLERF
jgi:hypothetical protein